MCHDLFINLVHMHLQCVCKSIQRCCNCFTIVLQLCVCSCCTTRTHRCTMFCNSLATWVTTCLQMCTTDVQQFFFTVLCSVTNAFVPLCVATCHNNVATSLQQFYNYCTHVVRLCASCLQMCHNWCATCFPTDAQLCAQLCYNCDTTWTKHVSRLCVQLCYYTVLYNVVALVCNRVLHMCCTTFCKRLTTWFLYCCRTLCLQLVSQRYVLKYIEIYRGIHIEKERQRNRERDIYIYIYVVIHTYICIYIMSCIERILKEVGLHTCFMTGVMQSTCGIHQHLLTVLSGWQDSDRMFDDMFEILSTYYQHLITLIRYW